MSTFVELCRPSSRLSSGWDVVPVAAFLMMATLPGRTHGLGLITTRLVEEFSLTDLQFAHLNFWATLIGALFCVPCGYLIDRFGLRVVASGVLAMAAFSILLMSRCQQVWSLAMSLVLLRGFAQGMLSVISITLVGKWFGKQVGPAMGIYAVLLSIMMGGATAWLTVQVAETGWRHAWSTQGWFLLFAVPVVALLTRNPPTTHVASASDPIFQSATLRDALFTPCFWIFTISISFFGLISSGLTLFCQLALAEHGFNESVYHETLVFGFVVGMVSSLIAGALAKRIALAKLLSVALLLLAVSLAWFPVCHTIIDVYLYVTIMGIAGGILTVMFFAVWRHAFGSKHLGQIQAAAQTVTVFASALGPIVVSLSTARTGSYAAVFFTSSIVALGLAILAWFTAVPNAQVDTSQLCPTK